MVKLKAFYEDAHKFYLVMELLTGGELLDSLIEKVTYSEAEARTLVETLARAIDYCHGKGVVHRDLKVRTQRAVTLVRASALCRRLTSAAPFPCNPCCCCAVPA